MWQQLTKIHINTSFEQAADKCNDLCATHAKAAFQC
jgi:hypothetical protein